MTIDSTDVEKMLTPLIYRQSQSYRDADYGLEYFFETVQVFAVGNRIMGGGQLMVHAFKMFIVVCVIAGFYQNCGRQGFNTESMVTQDSKFGLNSGNARDPRSESEFISKIFPGGSQGQFQKNSNCTFLGQASLPLVTNYPSIGMTGVPALFNPRVDAELAANQPYVSLYDSTQFSLPRVGNYLGNRFSIDSFMPEVSDNLSRFHDRLNQFCIGDLDSVRFVQGGPEVQRAGDLSALVQENAAYFQILHGLVFQNNLFTVVIPPHWQKATSGSLPTLFNGAYDLNGGLMTNEGGTLFEILAKTYQMKGKTGFGILWNGGGAIGSRTVDSISYRELNSFLKIFLSDFGAAANKLVTYGGSRGGVTAMNVASHPEVSSVKVAFVHASVPPYELDTIGAMATPTVPLLLTASDWSVGFFGSWRKSFRHPGGYTRDGFAGLTGTASHLKVLTGSDRSSDMKSEFNTLTASKIKKLKQNQTEIFLEVSSHDFIVPSTDQMKLVKDAIQAGLHIEARVNYLVGHARDNVALEAKLNSVFSTLVDRSPNGSSFVAQGKVKRYVVSPQGSFDALANDKPLLAVELPRFIVDEAEPMILASGAENAHYLLIFKNTTSFFRVNLDLDSQGLANLRLPPNLFPEGESELFGAYSLSDQGQPVGKVLGTSLVKTPLVISKLSGSILPYLSSAATIILNTIKSQGSYFDATVAQGSNYGFLEKQVIEIPASELELITSKSSPSSPPTQAVLECSTTNRALASFSMTGKIVPASRDIRRPGYFFIGGYDPNSGAWYSYDGASWSKHNNADASFSAVGGVSALTASGITGSIFANSDLRDFPNGQIYLGYGLGSSKIAAWNEMTSSQRYRLCETLPGKSASTPPPNIPPTMPSKNPPSVLPKTPSLATAAALNCAVLNSSLNSFTMTGIIIPASGDVGSPGFYYVAGLDVVRGEWWTFNGTAWSKQTTNNSSYLPISGSSSTSLKAEGIEGSIFNKADLSSFPKGQIYLGYGVGSTEELAWQNLIANSRYKLCATLADR
jgi:hypothetical protein